MARRRPLPGPPLAGAPPAECADAEGPDLRPDGRDAGRRDDVAARDAGGERNWDYRYAWIRDSTFGLWGLYTLGFDAEANDFFYFVADVAEGEADLQVMYAIDGERELREQILDHLSGYEGARPVRIGNDAYRQRQHDIWGALLDSVTCTCARGSTCPSASGRRSCRQVESALAAWREPDRGIWEVRGEPKHFTSSKVFCWLAADRGARLAAMHDEAELAARWHEAAGEIHDDVCANGMDDAASSCSTTTRPRSTPPCCCCRSFGSCRRPTPAYGRR